MTPTEKRNLVLGALASGAQTKLTIKAATGLGRHPLEQTLTYLIGHCEVHEAGRIGTGKLYALGPAPERLEQHPEAARRQRRSDERSAKLARTAANQRPRNVRKPRMHAPTNPDPWLSAWCAA